MSERDLRRIEVLSDVRAGRRTVAAAAAELAISERQAYRLLARYEVDGGSGLIHKARGRTSNRSRNEGIRKYAVELVKTRYVDFGPTLATDVLLEKHQLRIGKETLRRWMMADDRVANSFAFFWILPALALPVFILKLLWQGMPTLVFWLFFFGQGGSLALSNWNECVRGKCTTSNPFLVALSGFAYPPIWGWVVLALVSIALGTVRKSASRSVSSS